MKNIKFMQTFQADDHLDENGPYLTLLKILLFLFMLHDLLVQISIIGVLHDYTAITKMLP